MPRALAKDTIFFLLCLTSVCLSSVRANAAERGLDPQSEEFFEKRVRPVLAVNCFRCHGGQKTSGGLRVDSREALATGGDSGTSFDLDQPDESLLLLAIRRDDSVSAMPPDKPLDPKQVADLTAWIRAGAKWPEQTAKFTVKAHWAFEPIERPSIPAVQDAQWPKNNIDRFILAKLEAANLKPSPPADKRTLLRRVTYDLTGLPPAAVDVDAFERDDSTEPLSAVVNRLLASPQYGAHWGRHWLDLVRYADTAGENTDHPLPHAWRYRNWVLDAFNADMPYDQFVHEQLAGDILASSAPPDQYANRLVATGYLAIARRFGHDIDKDIHLTHEDIIDNLGKTFLGLSLGCCRCHDHKYDPLTARDYYGLYGIFASTRISNPGCEPKQQPRDLVPMLPAEEIARRNKPVQDEMALIDADLKQREDSQKPDADRLKETMAKVATILSKGEIEDGSSANVTASEGTGSIAVKRGDVLQLAITPQGNHGADSTLVELKITAEDATEWSIGDLVPSLLEGNPHSDNHGNRDVWAFLDLQSGPTFLPEALAQINGRGELQGWRNGDTPSVFVNSMDEPVTVWTSLPARSFFMHPGPNGPVGVAWISPIDGAVSIKCKITDVHRGADGVGWNLTHFASPEIGPSLVALGAARARIAELQKQKDEISQKMITIPVAYAAVDGTIANARIQDRGDPELLGEEVPRKFLDLLGGEEVTDPKSSGRRELGEWITAPTNPLAARVIVNRIWQWHFGRGLVATPNDFGTRGSLPSHPELLDYLASELIRSGWSLKALHRQILASATWQQASAGPDHSGLLASFPRRRLTAEELRDTLLAASGEIDLTPGAAHPFPPESTWSFTQHGPFAAEYDTPKRSVYVMQKRNRRTRFMALFDGPDPNASTPVRDVTTVPTQALYFLNDPFLHAQAEKFAQRILTSGASDSERVVFAWKTLFGREVSPEEKSDVIDFLSTYPMMSSEQTEPKSDIAAWSAYARILLSSNEVLHVD